MIARLPSGIGLAYDDAGSGAPLLLIHGWPHNRTIWSSQVSGLSTYARCIAPDLRGFGASTARGPWSVEQLADDLVSLLDVLKLDTVIACGLSMGGYVALALARHHRERLRALVLTGSRAAADTPAASEKRERLIELVERHGVEALADHQVRGMLSPRTLESRSEVRETLRRIMASASPEGAIGGQRAMMARPDASALVRTMRLPTLVVAGADDVLAPAEEQRALASTIPGSRFEILSNAGHACALERPAAFNHALAEFLMSLERN